MPLFLTLEQNPTYTVPKGEIAMMYPFLTLDDSAENIPCRNERQGMLLFFAYNSLQQLKVQKIHQAIAVQVRAAVLDGNLLTGEEPP